MIIQNDTSNRHSAVTMVAPISSAVRLPLSPLHVLLAAKPSTGLTVASVAVFNQIRAVDRARLIRRLGEVDAMVMLRVDEAIEAAFGLTSNQESQESPCTITKAISEDTKGFRTGRMSLNRSD